MRFQKIMGFFSAVLMGVGSWISVSASDNAAAPAPTVPATGAYWQSQLTQEERDMYTVIVQGLQAGQATITGPFESAGQEDFSKAFHRVTKILYEQHPEFFWLGNNQSMSFLPGTGFSFTPNRIFDTASAQADQAAIDTAVQEMMKKMPQDIYGKAAYIYQWIIDNSVYDHQVFREFSKDPASASVKYAHSFEITGVINQKKAVCQGYAGTFQYLCDKVGVPCITVTGKGDFGSGYYPHAWNYVQLEGNWYLVDTTWADTLTNGPALFFLRGSDSVGIRGKSFSVSHLPEDNGMFTYPVLSKTDYRQ